MGWTIYSGSVYSVSFSQPILSSIEDSGTAYTAAASVAAITAGKYYYDRQAKTLYLQASDSSNPNSRFLVSIFKLFFATAPVNEAWDLGSGYAVEWLPLLKPLSEFGVELDNINQIGYAIEGSGSIRLHNEQAYWKTRYDKFYFENNRCFIYSWNRTLPITEAKILYRGRVQTKSWNLTEISFELKDFLNELRAPLTNLTLNDLTTSAPLLSTDAQKWLQRYIYGYVSGFRPSNIDQYPNNQKTYSGTGSTWVVTNNSPTVTLSSGSFIGQSFIEGDQIRFEGSTDTTFYTIQTLAASTMTLSGSYQGITATSPDYTVKFALPETFYNRKFYVASHRLRSISTTVTSAVALNRFYVADATDILVGDAVTLGSETVTISAIAGNLITLSLNLITLPSVGATVSRPSILNVYLGDRLLKNDQYTISYNGEATLLTLATTAEFSVAPAIKLSGGNVQFNNGSRTVSGSGTFFKADVKPRDWIKATSQTTYYQVQTVDSDTQITLRSNAGYTFNEACIKKTPDYYSEGDSVISCDLIGLTVDGTSSAALLKTGPLIAKDILIRAGLSPYMVTSTFDSASSYATYRVGLVIPEKYDETTPPSIRDSINKINVSIFGALVQNEDFNLEYQVFRPYRESTIVALSESDIISLAITSASDNVSKTVIAEYGAKEYDVQVFQESIKTRQKTSNTAQYLAKSTKEYRFTTLLQDSAETLLIAERMSFILEVATSLVKFKTKMQGSRLQVTDKVKLSHEKLYQRLGSSVTSKVSSIQSAKKSHSETLIELDDLANAFARCATVAANSTLAWSLASDSDKMLAGFITDTYGMQNNDATTFGINLIW
jgi:hypothetical protein